MFEFYETAVLQIKFIFYINTKKQQILSFSTKLATTRKVPSRCLEHANSGNLLGGGGVYDISENRAYLTHRGITDILHNLL